MLSPTHTLDLICHCPVTHAMWGLSETLLVEADMGREGRPSCGTLGWTDVSAGLSCLCRGLSVLRILIEAHFPGGWGWGVYVEAGAWNMLF